MGVGTIKALLAAQGITLAPSPHYGCRELFRAGLSLGHFTADGACNQFLALGQEGGAL